MDAGPALAELERAGELVRGELRPLGTQREWCDPEVLRRLRRASLAVLRKEIEPVGQATLARFVPAWQGVDRYAPAGAGVDRLRDVLAPLQGLPLAPELWEKDVLPRRLGAYSPYWLDELCANGEVVWVGAGPLGGRSGRVALYFRDDAPLLGPPPAAGEPPERRAPRAACASASARGACFFADLLVEHPDAGADELREALWDLVWAGEVDQRRLRPAARARRATAAAPAGVRGARRAPADRALPPPRPRRAAAAGPLVAHAAVFARGAADRTRGAAPGPSSCSSATASSRASSCAPRGSRAASRPSTRRCRRSRPWAPPGAATSSRGSAAPSSRCRAPSSGCAAQEEAAGAALVLAAADPAQLYGAGLRWPDADVRPPARRAGAMWSRSAAGRRCRSTPAAARCASWAGRTTSHAGPCRPLPPPSAPAACAASPSTRIDGEPAVASPLAERLVALGFRRGLNDFVAGAPAMPEGDTIHHAALRIGAVLAGRVPDEIATPHPRFGRDRWPERLAGRRVEAVDARGKHLLLRFEGGLVVHSHLRMTGAWRVLRRGERWPRSPRSAWLVLRTGSTRSSSSTAPCWSCMTATRVRSDPRLAGLGPDIVAARAVRRGAVPAPPARGRPHADARRRAARPAHRRRHRQLLEVRGLLARRRRSLAAARAR